MIADGNRGDYMEIPKEEKRKLKTFQLNNKEDFIYYLYQLICR